ncbi:RHS repeat-associated core domain protein [Opitutaceae bacterium TAV1]|nr:RHS repeat-associated core domain protein [Opitutaceae bacterium TAV1]
MKRHLRYFLFVSLFWHLSFATNDQNPCTEEKEGCEVTKAPVLKVSTPEAGEAEPGGTVTRTFNYYIEPGEKITRDGNCETEEEPTTIEGILITPPSRDVSENVPCEPGGTVTLQSLPATATYPGCNGNVGLQLPAGEATVTVPIKNFKLIRVDTLYSDPIEVARAKNVFTDGNGTCFDVVTYGVKKGTQEIFQQTCPTVEELPGFPVWDDEVSETWDVPEEGDGIGCPQPPSAYALSFRDSGGPKYRKIALNGAPLSDEKPQNKEESDEPEEETFIDPLNLSLHHDTTDIYIPLPATELFLGVRRSVTAETWQPYCDFRPSEFLGKPFGANWSSNLSASIRFNHDDGIGYAYVTDDFGRQYTFVAAYIWTSWDDAGVLEYHAGYPKPNSLPDIKVATVYLPLPANSDDQQAMLCSLVEMEDGSFRFSRKYGSTLLYKPAVEQTVPYGRCDALKTYKYARLELATDKYGNALKYTYTGDTDIIPSKIQFVQVERDGFMYSHTGVSVAGGLPATISYGPAILISVNSHGYVQSVTDPRGKTVTYSYTTFNYVNPFENATYPHHQLTSVTAADGGVSSYTYSFFGDRDSKEPWDLGKARLQLELGSITDPLGQTYTFEHVQNHTNTWWHSWDGYFVSTGQPLLVSSVTLPDGSIATFETEASREFSWGTAGAMNITASRTTTVTDAMGNRRVYDFSDPVCESVRNWVADPNFDAPRLVYFRQTSIKSYSGSNTLLGEEIFKFDPLAGMSLTETTDFSGNQTTFTYDDPFTYSLGAAYGINGAIMSGRYADPTTQTDALGGVKRFTYGPHRIMTGITDENGIRTLYEVDAMGRRLKEQIIPAGNTTPVQETVFAYESATFRGFVTRKTVKKLSDIASWVTDLVVQYVPDATGRLWKEIVDPANLALTTLYTYDANGNKLTVTDPRGNTTAFGYDDRNRLTEVTYPGGATKTFTYDARGNKTSETDENGVTTLYAYDALNRVTTQTLVMGGTTPNLVRTFTYNALNSRTSETDPEGHTTALAYDALQRLISKTDPLGSATACEYGANAGGTVFDTSGWKPTLATDPRGFRTEVAYDKLYRPVQEKAEYQTGVYATTTKTYDAVGNLTSVTDPLGMVTATTYDALRRPLTITEAANAPALAAITTKSYTSTGLDYRTVDPLGGETLTDYDAAGRPVKVTGPAVTGDRPVTQTAYDVASNISAVTDPLGHTTDYTWDARNRRTHEVGPVVTDATVGGSLRPARITTYDPAGNIVAVQDARGNITTTEYDAARRPVKVTAPQVSLPDGTPVTPETTTIYDKNGNVLTVTDPNGHTTTNTYDALNRLLTTTDAEGITVTNEYDAVGNRTAVIDGKGQRTEFGYDGLKRNTTTTDPAGEVVTLSYDAMHKTARVDAQGRRTDYTYDARHRLAGVNYAGRTQDNRSYTYDKMSRILTVTEPGKGGIADVIYVYDALGRMVSEKSHGLTHLYTYDLAGNRTKVIYGGTGTVLNSTYDALNRLATLTEGGRMTTYGYDLDGNRVKRVLPNGDTTVTQFDGLNRQTSVVTTRWGGPPVLVNLTQGYDAAGNLAKLIESIPGTTLSGRTVTNSYDGANRLAGETVESNGKMTTTAYAYDAAHNRTEKTVAVTEGGTTTTTVTEYTYNNLNQVLASVTDEATIEYEYDPDGNRIARTGTTYQQFAYDHENRLVEFSEQGYQANLTIPSSLFGGGHDDWNIYIRIPIEESNHPALALQAGDSIEILSSAQQGVIGVYELAQTSYIVPLDAYYIVFRLVGATRESGASGGKIIYRIGNSEGPTPCTFHYDYRTRRVQAGAPGVAGGFTRFVFSGGTSVQERTATVPSGALVAENIRGSDWGGGVGGLLYSLRGGMPGYNHYNSRGDVIAKTDNSGTVTFAAQYEAFGNIKEQVGSNPDRQRSNTKDWDIPGYVNEGFRFRDLETGSFISRDPLGFVDGPNMYAYVVQNPWTKFDPLGLERDKDKVKITREGHHVNPVENWKDNKELSPEVRQRLDDHRLKPAPGGESARHTWSKAHELYNETTGKIQADFLKEARKAGIDPSKLTGDEAKKFADDMIKKMMKNEYVSGFNSIVRSGKGTAENLNKLRGAFLSSGKKSGWLGRLRSSKKIPGIGAIIGTTLFVIDAKAEGVGRAAENFVKDVTYYDVAEVAGNAYRQKSDDVRYNVEHGSFNEDKAGNIGRYYNDLNKAYQETPGATP